VNLERGTEVVEKWEEQGMKGKERGRKWRE
jgi:hypothetical protein